MNKFVVNSAVFYQGLEIAKKVIDRNRVVNIIEHFLLEVSGNSLTITGTDLRNTLQVQIPVKSQAKGAVVIPQDVLKYLKTVELQPLVITWADDTMKIEITDEDGKAVYKGESAGDFPKIPEVNNELFKFQPHVLQDIKGLLPYASDDQLRPAMGGIFFNYRGGRLEAVATNGHMLAITALGYNTPDKNEGLFILDGKAAKVLSSFKLADKPITLYSDDPQKSLIVAFTFDIQGIYTIRLTSRVIDERYPDYAQVIPKESTTKMTFAVETFAKALTKALMFANRTTHQVNFDIVGAAVKVSATNYDDDSSYAGVVPAIGEGKDLDIAFNGEFLQKLLKNFDGSISLEMSAPNKAAVVKNDRTLVLLMPVMRNQY